MRMCGIPDCLLCVCVCVCVCMFEQSLKCVNVCLCSVSLHAARHLTDVMLPIMSCSMQHVNLKQCLSIM